MARYQKGAQNVCDIKYHVVLITKYRKPVLGGKIGKRVRDLMRGVHRIKGVTSRKLLGESKMLDKTFWGRYLCAGRYFVATTGNVTE